MGTTIPKDVKDLWEKWNIRVLIIFSLSLQVILVFFAPNRKRTSGKLFQLLIWFAYLLADWSANFTIGQISEIHNSYVDGGEPSTLSHEILAFWAPFLLLHLGGPDTITALALEDNELWRRHLFGLICQAVSTIYVLMLSIPSMLLVPTTLMIVAGVIKFVERIRALYLASSGKFKGSILRKHERLTREENPTAIQNKFNVPVKPDRELRDLEIVQYAYKLFNISKGLVPDLRLGSQGWDEGKRFFESLNPEEALRVLEVELSFMYDDFFTKVIILLTRVGLFFRFIALGCLVSSLGIFLLKKKDNYQRFDVDLTYALLIGGIVIELVVTLMVCISDRTIAITRKLKEGPGEAWSLSDRFLNWVLSLRTLKWKRCRCSMNEEGRDEAHKVLDRAFIFRRWSEYINGYSLVGFCIRKSPEKTHHPNGCIRRFIDMWIIRYIRVIAQEIFSLIGLVQGGKVTGTIFYCVMQKHQYWALCLCCVPLIFPFCLLLDLFLWGVNYFWYFTGVQNEITEMIFKSSDRLPEDLWTFIFKEVRHKSSVAVDHELSKRIASARGDWTIRVAKRESLLQYVTVVDYGHSILLWHIATDLVYNTETKTLTEEQRRCKEYCKMLSDYMMYLMMMQPDLTSAVVGTWKMKFADTSLVATKFFKGRAVDVRKACSKLLSKERFKMMLSMEDESTLEDACKLAEELLLLERRREGSIWGLMSRVWVELLCYAANHCDSKQHAAQLSKGGELVSFVWLLMAHLGLGKHATVHHPA